MDDSWHQTNQIVMAVQTAELRQDSVDSAPELHLSCSLVTIARGQCQLELEVDDNKSDGIGKLTIEVNRPVMRGRAALPSKLFEAISHRLATSPPRPISLTLNVDTQLAVSIEGDLRSDAETTIGIQDIAVTLPLK